MRYGSLALGKGLESPNWYAPNKVILYKNMRLLAIFIASVLSFSRVDPTNSCPTFAACNPNPCAAASCPYDSKCLSIQRSSGPGGCLLCPEAICCSQVSCAKNCKQCPSKSRCMKEHHQKSKELMATCAKECRKGQVLCL